MSSRIETQHPLAVLCELPDRWAQACITNPAPIEISGTVAVLRETRRVLRDDGTLWLLLSPPGSQPLLDELHREGWHQQPTPRWGSPLAAPRAPRLYLLSKTPRYFCDTYPGVPRPPRNACSLAGRTLARGASCPAPRELQLVRRCVLAGSSPLACGACGAPYRRARPGESDPDRRRATCPHSNRAGACLVLDPFYRASTPVLQITEATGRHLLALASLTASRGVLL